MAAKSQQEINPMVDSAHGNKTLSISLRNRITEAIKYKKTAKMTKWSANIMVAVGVHLERPGVKLSMQPISGRPWLSPWLVPGLVSVLG
jgi:hypothetical protein